MLATASATPPHIMTSQSYGSDASRLAAVRRRDKQADGSFYYSVSTTGVYCHPSCAARPAKRENMAFHDTREAAERAGFRACKRCRPDLPPRALREAALVSAACRIIEQAEEAPSLTDLAAQAGLSPHYFHRLFRRIAGVTPKAYAGAQRQARLQSRLAAGAAVTEAIYESGFNSSGRFYDSADAMLGMVASRYRQGGQGEAIGYACGPSSLGTVLVAATARGVCAILLGDDPDRLVQDLRARFPKADLAEAEPQFSASVARIVAMVDAPAQNGAIGLPLDIRGTAFQRRVWEVLRAIPAGQTRSYGDIARELGNPAATRAVAGACAANALAVAIPCHRVVAADGGLAGYRWGVERKRTLLAKERA
jgi:AraC family transcriptional regulator of adaptative response/methylated-DNA-[protein]-cysteine methyltransferase